MAKCLHFLLLLVHLATPFEISNVFTDYMVLQWDTPSVYGTGTAGSRVDITVSSTSSQSTQHFSGKVKSDGTWDILLSGYEASLEQFVLDIKPESGKPTTFHNVTFGDVFICSGQSNMRFVVCQSFNGTKEVEEAYNPHIRVFTVTEKPSPEKPLHHLTSYNNSGWQPVKPSTVGNGRAFTIFSAVCYYYARDIFKLRGGKVPLGLISTVIGGTPLQAWTPRNVLEKCNGEESPVPKPDWLRTHPHLLQPADGTTMVGEEQCRGGDPHPPHFSDPSALWNGMVVPILGVGIKGILWYQGENNAHGSGIALYKRCFPPMMEAWQAAFRSKNGRVPFLFVQLAPCPDANGFVGLRFSQAYANKVTPDTGMSTAIDLGSPFSPYGAVHIQDKQEVGRRLALLGNNLVYGDKSSPTTGPTLQKAEAKSQTEVHLTYTGSSSCSFRKTAFCDAMYHGKRVSECCVGSPFVFHDEKGGEVKAKAWKVVNGCDVHITLEKPGTVKRMLFDATAYPGCCLYDDKTGIPANPANVSVAM